jgi:phage-related protein (TIGR01555 family)
MANSSKKQTKVKDNNADGWSNVITNLGASNSRVNSTGYAHSCKLDRATLTDIYITDGLGRRVVNILIDDALRSFVHCEKPLLDELVRMKSKQTMIDCATWARLYGGSAIVVFADDGQDMDKPLNMQTIKKVVSIKSYDRYQMQASATDMIVDYYDENYGEPATYSITPCGGMPFTVHRTRMHFFSGERLPNHVYYTNQRWHGSVLDSVYIALRNYGQTMNASAEIVQDFIQVILGINGLTDMLRSGNDDLVTKRSTVIDLTRSVSNTIFLDSEQENYQKQASNVGGLAELWDRFAEAISGATGIPISKLLGRSPSGLNSSGQSDIDNWNNIVEAYRGDEIAPCVDWLIKLLNKQSTWENSKRPTNYNWSFPSLKISNESEIAKNRLLSAQLDQIYIDRSAVDAEFLFKKRYAGGAYNNDIIIEESELESEAEPNDENDINLDDIKNKIAMEDRVNKDSANKLDMLEKKKEVDNLASELCRKMLERL